MSVIHVSFSTVLLWCTEEWRINARYSCWASRLFHFPKHHCQHYPTTTYDDMVDQCEDGAVGKFKGTYRKYRGRHCRTINWHRSCPFLHTYVRGSISCYRAPADHVEEYFSYNVEALLTLFWAGALGQSIFGFADIASLKRIRHKTNTAVKIVAILLPALLISLLRVPSIRNSFTAFIIVANINSMFSHSIKTLYRL